MRVHYDFASTLCYVAHRVMQRMAPTLEALDLELDWTPVDLTGLAAFRRGMPIPAARQANVCRVAAELGVPVRIPAVWLDSRPPSAAALLAERTARAAAWRERVFSAVHEEGRDPGSAEQTRRLGLELGLRFEPEDLERGAVELAARTAVARDEMVTGVPTFMLGRWPFAGIQEEETMGLVLARFANRARAGGLA